jgi:hypothetical protein
MSILNLMKSYCKIAFYDVLINRHLVLYKVISEVKYEALQSRAIFVGNQKNLRIN